jgi:hypothetical protein
MLKILCLLGFHKPIRSPIEGDADDNYRWFEDRCDRCGKVRTVRSHFSPWIMRQEIIEEFEWRKPRRKLPQRLEV